MSLNTVIKVGFSVIAASVAAVGCYKLYKIAEREVSAELNETNETLKRCYAQIKEAHRKTARAAEEIEQLGVTTADTRKHIAKAAEEEMLFAKYDVKQITYTTYNEFLAELDAIGNKYK